MKRIYLQMCVCETRKRTRTKGDKSREGLNRKGLAEITLIKVRDERDGESFCNVTADYNA